LIKRDINKKRTNGKFEFVIVIQIYKNMLYDFTLKTYLRILEKLTVKTKSKGKKGNTAFHKKKRKEKQNNKNHYVQESFFFYGTIV
jgi:hypothetical protein